MWGGEEQLQGRWWSYFLPMYVGLNLFQRDLVRTFSNFWEYCSAAVNMVIY